MSATATAPLHAQGDSADFVRLHITPLDAELLSTYLSPTLLQLARNISFHVPETWPEKRFGFVELPQPEATKLRKKLHGSIFKGARVRIEVARSQTWQKRLNRSESSASCDYHANSNQPQPVKRQKKEAGVLEGVRLEGRKVVRGWTEPLDTKIRSKRSKDAARERVRGDKKRSLPASKYTDNEECLLRLKLPPCSSSTMSDSSVRSGYKKHTRSTITIHEFEHTTRYPSFLKVDPPLNYGQPAAEYIQGKGWVAPDGSVIEEARAYTKKKIEPQVTVESSAASSDAGLDNGTASSSKSVSAPQDQDFDHKINTANDASRAACACTYESKETGSTACHDEAHCRAASSHVKLDDPQRPQSSSLPSTNLSIAIPSLSSPSTTKPVHALEALYKRNKIDSAGQKNQIEPFHFFDSSNGGDDEMEYLGASYATPLTPRADRDRRSIRSSAPTPDTAKPSERRIFWSKTGFEGEEEDKEEEHDQGDDEGDDEDEDDEECNGEAPYTDMGCGHEYEAPTQLQIEDAASADFPSWFWQNRSHLNRSWMKRRKMAAKEERYKNNKTRAARAV
ncbi:hypothetical protein CDD81_7013 [Ophiocordyceps australis]|uniref:RRM domain-containing protein n=1 Tax=Ophiocordyceps australis TaxID=1399860 RepID=A0A2C5XLP9_9HYPO|nr:hypothetical protein CDD81_7013 [Ophiocordyceps australis]